MRRLSAALVALVAAIAFTALSAPAWAAKPTPKKPTPKQRQLVMSPTEVHAGQKVKVSGGGCKGITILVLLVDAKAFYRGPTKSGDFTFEVKLPASLKSGDHDLSATCRGGNHKPARFHVSKKQRSRTSFDVSPDTVIAGDRVHAEGTGCKWDAPVYITWDGRLRKRTFADEHGTFDTGLRISRHTKRGRHVVSAFCPWFIGSDGIKVKNPYRHHRDHVDFGKNVVRPGHKFRIHGDDCPDGQPVAWMDNHKPVAVDVSKKGKGFTGEAWVPKGTSAGRHKFHAGCDGGSTGDTTLDVLDPEDTGWSADRKPFGPQPSSDLAMWAGLFAGIALLVASAFVTTRRRGHRG
jgi:hypothetical protein